MAIRPMRYMWSAMLSGPATPRLTHPVRFWVCGSAAWYRERRLTE